MNDIAPVPPAPRSAVRGPPAVVVIGAGPAGLTAASELVRAGIAPHVLERDHIVGGIARTEVYKGYRFDMGGHRFFTKSPDVQRFWKETLGDRFLRRPRLSRIYYKKQFFMYPLKPLNALAGLGLRESVMIMLSYLRWKLRPHPREDSFAEWVTNRFGRRLFRTFFKSYTEKVWGIGANELSAEWAAQRIKNLSLKSALTGMIVKPGQNVTSLIEEFDYPVRGPGMMWEAVQARVESGGGRVSLNHGVVRLLREGNRVVALESDGPSGRTRIEADAVISSMPITEVIQKLDPPPPPSVQAAAARLKYRDFLTVCLIIDQPELFPDNWIYVHDPEVKVGRIQNFKRWSPAMVPDPATTSLGLEYFCNEGDALWTSPDDRLIALATREIETTGLAQADRVIDGCVFRVPKSYPVYDSTYRAALAEVRAFVDGLACFQTIGRNGLHRYNNQDHAMLTGMLAVRNLLHGADYDLWAVNEDQSYLEETAPPATPRGGASCSRSLAAARS